MRLVIGTRLATLVAIMLASATGAADSWELRPASAASPGSREILAGRPDDAIRILLPALRSATPEARLAILQNLCVAHALNQDYKAAMSYCDRATVHRGAGAMTFNNRGVVRAVTGDYRGAVRDFRRANCLTGCGFACGTDDIRAAVSRNLARLTDRRSVSDLNPVYFRRGV